MNGPDAEFTPAPSDAGHAPADPSGRRQTPIPPHRDPVSLLKHLALFLLTFASVSFTGILWVGKSAGDATLLTMLSDGVLFAVLLLAFLGVHEFGHYIAAVRHGLRTSLPWFIPVPFGIGTLGAIIRIRDRIRSTVVLFDVGISGPVAGFVVSITVLLVGFFTLPEPTFIANFAGHEPMVEYIEEHGRFPDEPMMAMPTDTLSGARTDGEGQGQPGPDGAAAEETPAFDVLVIGDTLLYSFIASFFADAPPMFEMYHYPFLFAGWLGLFFTALNLMPVGQLDGGHILYALVGYEAHRTIARIVFAVLVTLGGIEAIPLLTVTLLDIAPSWYLSSFALWAVILLTLLRRAYNRDHRWVFTVWVLSLSASIIYLLFIQRSILENGSLIWLVWSFFIVYFIRLEHPPTTVQEPLSPVRRVLGWSSMVIFVLCFSLQPITLGS